MPYTTKLEISNFLLTTIDASFNTQITSWINAVTAYIEVYTGRKFETETDTVKDYDGSGNKTLEVADLTDLDSVSTLDNDRNVDQTIDASDEYWLYPENEGYKNRIVIDASNAPFGVFPKGHQNIRVTASWGVSATVPYSIKLAATMLVSAIAEKGLKGGNIINEKLGDYSVSFESIKDAPNYLDAMEILSQYRKITV